MKAVAIRNLSFWVVFRMSKIVNTMLVACSSVGEGFDAMIISLDAVEKTYDNDVIGHFLNFLDTWTQAGQDT